MKDLTYLITLAILPLFSPNSLTAQEIEIGNNYYFISSLGHNLSDEKMKLNENAPIPHNAEIKKRAKINVSDVTDNKVYFTYLKYKNDTSSATNNYKTYNTCEETDSNGEKTQTTPVFSLSKSDFKKFTSTYYNPFRGFRAGAYSVPIRLRIFEDEDFEFEGNLSLGANVSGRVGFSRYKEHLFTDISVGVSITKVNLNADNSRLGTTGIDENSGEAFNFEGTDTSSPAAITFSTGLLFNLAKNVNIGSYLGWDFISSSDNKAKWIYNGVPWVGVGINVSFGDAQKSDNQQSTQ